MVLRRIFGDAQNSYFELYGDANSGAKTVSSDVSYGGVYHCTTFTVEAGNTLTLPQGIPLIVLAEESITIDGTIDGDGKGGLGGAGGKGSTNSATPPEDGEDVKLFETQYGGDGGGGGSDDNGVDGSDGSANNGGIVTYPQRYFDQLKTSLTLGNALADILDNSITAGCGGGGGDPGSRSGTIVAGGDGGDGGNGGGLVVFIAPDITINGTVTLQGQDGGDGSDGSTYNDDYASGAGGGGGGGSGGTFYCVCEYYTNNGTVDVSNGVGGLGGTGQSVQYATGGDGGDGTDGSPGDVYILQP